MKYKLTSEQKKDYLLLKNRWKIFYKLVVKNCRDFDILPLEIVEMICEKCVLLHSEINVRCMFKLKGITIDQYGKHSLNNEYDFVFTYFKKI